jgi:hypothetical protein
MILAEKGMTDHWASLNGASGHGQCVVVCISFASIGAGKILKRPSTQHIETDCAKNLAGESNAPKVTETPSKSGCFSICTNGMDFDALCTFG